MTTANQIEDNQTGQTNWPGESGLRQLCPRRLLMPTLRSSADQNAIRALKAGSRIVAPFVEAARPMFAPVDPFLGAMDGLLPGLDLQTRWQEFENQIEIFLLVPSVESHLGIKPGCETPLAELVERAYGLGSFLALWAIEGIGHYLGDCAQKRESDPRGLLTDPAALGLPRSSLTMVNAGIGMSLAKNVLAKINFHTPVSEIMVALSRFIDLCKQNATPGYLGATVESLGLVVRTFHSGLVGRVNDILHETQPEFLGYYWHGVGRGVYFSPGNLVPGSQINWATVAAAVPTELARHNLIAGLAWAVTLVNMRQPAVMDRLVQRFGETLIRSDAFANGVSSAIVMRNDITPHSQFLSAFCRYGNSPERRQPQATDLWLRLVQEPCHRALNEEYPRLESQCRLDQIFRYRPLPHSTATDSQDRWSPTLRDRGNTTEGRLIRCHD